MADGRMSVTRIAGLPRRSGEPVLDARREGGSNSVVESQPSKLLVAGSIPVSRSIRLRAPDVRARSGAMPYPSRSITDRSGSAKAKADVAQLAERVLGKDEVSSSILDIGSTFARRLNEGCSPAARSTAVDHNDVDKEERRRHGQRKIRPQ